MVPSFNGRIPDCIPGESRSIRLGTTTGSSSNGRMSACAVGDVWFDSSTPSQLAHDADGPSLNGKIPTCLVGDVGSIPAGPAKLGESHA